MDILAVRGDEGRLLDSDMQWRAVKYALTHWFPNGETPLSEMAEDRMLSKVGIAGRTQGTETSKYLKEE